MLGQFLKQLRKSVKKTLRTVEAETGISNAHLSQLENDKIKKPAPELLEKLARYYSINSSELLSKAGYDINILSESEQIEKSDSNWKSGIQNILPLVKATHLVQFADRREAEGKLPELVRFLIGATSYCNSSRIPSGDSINLPGWDGKTEVTKNNEAQFVPSGITLWEMSKNKNIEKKINSDFAKRTSNSHGENTSNATFIFVTPRHWEKKDDWIIKKKKSILLNSHPVLHRVIERILELSTIDTIIEHITTMLLPAQLRWGLKRSPWKDIRVYDADDLEHWLATAPSVGLWLAREIGIFPDEKATTLFTFWNEWLNSTNPPLDHILMSKALPGAKEEIQQFLSQKTSNQIIVYADEIDISIAYLCSIIEMTMNQEQKSQWLSRTIIIEDRETFRKLCNPGHQLILIPKFEGAPIGTALKNGHKVFIPQIGAIKNEEDLTIKRISIQEIQEHLQSEGLKPEHEAYRISKSTHGSITVLRRLIANELELTEPCWVNYSLGIQLIPLLFAGSWNSSIEGDRKIISELSGKSYEEFELLIQSQCNEENPPCQKIGSIYSLVSQEYVYSYLREYISPTSLNRLNEVIQKVLGETDPRYELDKEKRCMASIYGKDRKYSGFIRKGLVSILALLATQPPSSLPKIESFVSTVVRELFKKSNSWQFWASISSELTTIAEAAPEQFLDMVEDILDENKETFIELFNQKTDFGGFEYANLLWALECCAWNQKYLGRAAQILVQLSEIEERLQISGNKPSSCLYSIMRLWWPQTNTPVKRRFEIIDSLENINSDRVWKLLIALIPSQHMVASSNNKPEFRNWVDNSKGKEDASEIYEGAELICKRLPSLLQKDPKRWVDLLEKVFDIPFINRQNELLEILQTLDLNSLSENNRIEIWAILEQKLYMHKKYSNERWAIGESTLIKLEAAYRYFIPEDPIVKWSRIFTFRLEHPDYIYLDNDYKREREVLEKLQTQAVEEVFQLCGLEGIYKLCSKVKNSSLLGFLAARNIKIIHAELQILNEVDYKNKEYFKDFLKGFIRQRFHNEGLDWFKDILFKIGKISVERSLFLLLSIPFTKETWKIVEEMGDNIKDSYWKKIPILTFPVDLEDYPSTISNYLEYNRPFAAFFLLMDPQFIESEEFSDKLAMAVLNGLSNGDFQSDDWKEISSSFNYHLEKILELLRKTYNVDCGELAKIEWIFLPFLGFEKKPSNLINFLNSNPIEFARIIAMTYKSEKNEDIYNELEDIIKEEFGKRGFDLLQGHNIVPGKLPDGSLDGDYLKNWIEEVRKQCKKSGHLGVADSYIGKILSYSPIDPSDECWPHLAVREIIEKYRSKSLENGFEIGINNRRGSITKSLSEGGNQERDLAKKYGNWAENCEGKWIRTSKVLREVENRYRKEAIKEDNNSELNRYWFE